MKIVYSALQFDKMNPSRGLSFEHSNFYESLTRFPGAEVLYFPYERMLDVGKEKMNQELLEAVRHEKPDLFFAFMYTDELDTKTLDAIKNITKSVAWFPDDHWRFDNYSKYYAPHFSWVVTTYSKAVEKYKEIGIQNVIHSQWAANTSTYKPSLKSKDIDVSFVGSWNKERGRVIRVLLEHGIRIEVYGNGWKNGRIQQKELVEIIGRSKISLGLNPSSAYIGIKPLIRFFFKRSGRWIVPDFWNFFDNVREWRQKSIPQIKARIFEIPACRSLLFTQIADTLAEYYKPGEECVIYEDLEDLIVKIQYYLQHNEERENITLRGYERTLRDHTYERRFSDIFKILEL